MSSRLAIAATALLFLTACRQAESPLPTPDEDVREELNDVRRDLQDIASNRDAAAGDALAQDVRKYVVRPSAVPAVDEMTRLTAAALPGRIVPDEAGDKLAYSLWVAATARELSESQIEALQNDVQAQLVALGVPQDSAQAIGAQVGRVQGAVTDRQRRWYELF
jgi:hypothetical protein